ncbi:MAG: phosphoglycerate dehydrogenase [Anaerolineales bacterium]|jgi:D-3-phosphoglycerate dehydrogenase
MSSLSGSKVLVTATSYASQDERLRTVLEEKVGEVVYNTTGRPLSSSQLQELLPNVDGMIAGLDEIDAAALASANKLKVVARYGVGYDNVDLEAARLNHVTVTNTPGANSKSVAELTITLILNLLRPVISAAQKTKQGEWPRFKGISLQGKTVGLVGCGAIGKDTARKLAGFDCEILAFDIDEDKIFASEYGVRYVPLEALLAESDIVSLHLPGIPETSGLVNLDFIGKMKPGSFLINTARGDLLDEDALADALRSGYLRGAAVDVFKQEPPDADNPLLHLDQVIVTPHMGSHSDSATNAMGWMALEECLAVLQGKEPKYRIV